MTSSGSDVAPIEFFRALYGEGELPSPAALFIPGENGSTTEWATTVDEIEQFRVTHGSSPATVCYVPALFDGSSRKEDSLRQILALVLDFDGKTFVEKPEDVYRNHQARAVAVTEALVRFNRAERHLGQATACVVSGYGIHGIWVYRDPVDVSTDIKASIKSAYKAIASQFEADKQSSSLCQPYRMPGTINAKGSENQIAKLIALRPDARVDLNRVLELANSQRPAVSSPTAATPRRKNPLGQPIREGDRHRTLTVIAGHARNGGLQGDELLLHLRAANDCCEPPLEDAEVERIAADISKKSGRPGRQKKAEETVAYSAWFPGLVDVVEHDGRSRYLIKDSTGGVRLEEQWQHGGGLLHVPAITELPYLLPNADNLQAYLDEPEDPARLFDDLREYYLRAVELPCDEVAIALAAWTLLTYRQEDVLCMPILFFYGPTERGKSRLGRCITYVSYRGVIEASVREANMFRYSSDVHATLFLDLTDAWATIQKGGAEDIILNSFERGARVRRVLHPDKGPFADSRWFDTFGPRIIASNKDVPDPLGSRSLPVQMPEAMRVDFADIKEADCRTLRERCVAWRSHTMGEEIPVVEAAARGRLGDITRPILGVIRSVAPGHEAALRSWIEAEANDRRDESGGSLEALIARAVVELRGKHPDQALVPYDEVQTTLERLSPAALSWSKDPRLAIGYGLKKLGMQKKRKNVGMCVVLQDSRIIPIARRYGVEFESVESSSEPTCGGDAPASPAEDPSQPSPPPRVGSDGGIQFGEGSAESCTNPSPKPSPVNPSRESSIPASGEANVKGVNGSTMGISDLFVVEDVTDETPPPRGYIGEI